ncbi:unnamed protein product [Strongylus vulgaris]|uniref:Uncharacterized protein n=1 Tax=Strongylus vulgaris TaxID=40348 RepID=A0A3P7LGZ4_STRVU|nr:unnamed protein product [Strongylus vulgaris]
MNKDDLHRSHEPSELGRAVKAIVHKDWRTSGSDALSSSSSHSRGDGRSQRSQRQPSWAFLYSDVVVLQQEVQIDSNRLYDR